MNRKGRPAPDISGQKFGRWTVIRRNGIKGHNALWLCQCECGNQKSVLGTDLRRGHVRSCGCYHASGFENANTKHGMTKTPEYSSWEHMKYRCYNPKDKRYKEYGGRGITVCERWFDSFENFLADMGQRPSMDHSLDRKNVNGNYEPNNCRWATRKEQRNNRRDSVKNQG